VIGNKKPTDFKGIPKSIENIAVPISLQDTIEELQIFFNKNDIQQMLQNRIEELEKEEEQMECVLAEEHFDFRSRKEELQRLKRSLK
jgi:hypothetical protein